MSFYKILIILLVFILTNGQNNEKLEWWQTSVIYQIYPRSFLDSNNDGIGDLKGIEQASHYFAETGIGAIWLSPIFKSPMADMGYDISDYRKIDPIFGSNSDFESLQKVLKSKGVKLVLDFVPNHSSDEHDWFKKSVKKIDPYTDYYVWVDPKYWRNETYPIPPNNWISVFGGSAWEYVPERKQFYLHQFAIKQPDLNYRSKALVEEMKNIIRFWLDKGVDGFRMDAVPSIFEDEKLRDEPIISNETDANGYLSYNSLDHIHTNHLPETYDLLRQFREILDTYKKQDGHTRLMMIEAYGPVKTLMKYYGNDTNPIGHIPFNFILLMKLNKYSKAQDFNTHIHSWLDNLPKGKTPNWVLGNHDNSRISTRFGKEMVDGINMLILLLPGSGITYNGEEIGMEDTSIRWEQVTDIGALNAGPKFYEKYNRDPERTPFQWNSKIHAGFSEKNGTCWLPVNPNYYYLNHELQKKTSRSHYNVYKALIKLRSHDVFQKGDIQTYVVSERVFAFKRNIPNHDIFLVILNLNNEEEFVHLYAAIKDLPEHMYVVIPSINSEYYNGDKLKINDKFKMRPQSALVLTDREPYSKDDSVANTGAYTRLTLFILLINFVIYVNCY